MDQVRRLVRPTDVPDSGLICDLLWADPDKDIAGWEENDRGVSFIFGPDATTFSSVTTSIAESRALKPLRLCLHIKSNILKIFFNCEVITNVHPLHASMDSTTNASAATTSGDCQMRILCFNRPKEAVFQ